MIEQPSSAGTTGTTDIVATEIASDGEAATARLAARLADLSGRGDVLALDGPLGSGKTVFARGFIRALTRPDEEVPSPTFTLVQIYESGRGPIHHFDLYRIEAAAELDELGLEEAFADGITLIEWPGRAAALRTERWLTVHFAIAAGPGEQRTIGLHPGAAWRARLEALDLDDDGSGHAR